MSPPGVVSEARRRAAQTHARRPWTCACGRVVYGNGGKSSHRRACLEALRQDVALVGELVRQAREREGASDWLLVYATHRLELARAALKTREAKLAGR